ncbi:MAG: aspartyl protease family protein [Candidatus Aquilonibacter sp.]
MRLDIWRWLVASIAAGILALNAQPAPSAPACRASDVLAQMRSATGGDRWNNVAAIAADGRAAIAGLAGSGRFDEDVVGGRYAHYFDIAVMGQSAEVYDGTTVWSQDISGGVHPYNTPYARERAVTSAYLTRRAYFDPRVAVTIACLGSAVEAGRPITVIRIQPRGGIPAQLAIDAQTHLLASISERLPLPGDDSVTRFADYRTVGELVLPFSISLGTKTDPTDGFALEVRHYTILPHVRATDFARPASRNDARMLGGTASTTVPLRLEERQLLIWASIDGHAPMPFILDTGGHAILTTLAAKSLGLAAQGTGESGGSGAGTIATHYTRVRSVRVGDAELLDQPFLVIPYPYAFYERGKRTPLAGILGLEIFERFAVRIDYGDRRVTLAPLSTFHHHGGGATVPLMFEDQEDMPVVRAAADGHPGLFGTDTGNAGVLILFGNFLEHTGLDARYSDGFKTIGQGTGGRNTGRLETLRHFSVDGHHLDKVLANFTHMTSGSFSSFTEAGNFGLSILSRFVPTFDYASDTLYLDPEIRQTPFILNRSGIGFAKNQPDAFDVLLVKPGSPGAAAGIVAGDRIVAVNGKDATNYSAADFSDLVTQSAGTRLALRIEHAGSVKDVTLVLR